MTSSQAGNCSHIFWTIMSTVLCLDPWKWPAVNSKGKEGNVSAEFYMHIYMNIYHFRFSYVCVCMTETQLQTGGERERSRLRERRNVLWYLNDYNEFLSSRSAHCCDLIWFLSDAEMLHYQVGSKLCLNQLQWDPVRPNGHRGPSGREWRRMEEGGW